MSTLLDCVINEKQRERTTCKRTKLHNASKEKLARCGYIDRQWIYLVLNLSTSLAVIVLDTQMIIFIDLAGFFIRRPYPMMPALVKLFCSVAIALRKINFS